MTFHSLLNLSLIAPINLIPPTPCLRVCDGGFFCKGGECFALFTPTSCSLTYRGYCRLRSLDRSCHSLSSCDMRISQRWLGDNIKLGWEGVEDGVLRVPFRLLYSTMGSCDGGSVEEECMVVYLSLVTCSPRGCALVCVRARCWVVG